jgi:signal transduction histidine kinase/CheY-like chemotaxis protein
MIVQTRFHVTQIASFIGLNFIGWGLAHAMGWVGPSSLPALYTISVMALLLTGILAGIIAFVKSEKALSNEVASRFRELDQTRMDLEKEESANTAKTTFLANVSHELRTPLGAILGYADLLKSNLHLEGENAEFLDTILRNGHQLSKLVDDLLDISKIDAGKIEIETIAFQPREILAETAELLSLSAKQKSIALTTECGDSVPKWIVSDPTRLRQILLNIVANAIKYTERGAVHVSLTYDRGGTSSMGASLIAEVRDTGRGISEEEQKRLFKPFSQADASMSRKYGGTGLGLDLSRKLARRLGGEVSLASSRIGKGSIFSVRIPAPEASRAATPSWARSGSGSAASEKRLKGVRVLVVDDTRDNQRLIGKYLSTEGALTEFASDGLAASRIALGGRFDLVLMDLQMPVLDGLAAASLLRQQGYQTPIVALTAHAMKEDRDRCLAAGFDGYLVKPIDRELLIATVGRYGRVRAEPTARVPVGIPEPSLSF